jgi:hypothetical protein
MAARWKLENDSTIIQGAKDMKLFNESAATLRKYRILQSNRLGFNVYAKSLKMGKDLDPRTANKRLASALESAGVPVRYMSGDEEYERAENDLNYAATHIVMPVGLLFPSLARQCFYDGDIPQQILRQIVPFL